MDASSLQAQLAQLLRQVETDRERLDDMVAWSESFEAEMHAQTERISRRESQLLNRVNDLADDLASHRFDRRYHPNA